MPQAAGSCITEPSGELFFIDYNKRYLMEKEVVASYLFLFVFLLVFFITWVIQRSDIAKNFVDIPNHRSSHVLPTPKGGGIAFVIGFLTALPFVDKQFAAFLAAGSIIAAIGVLDDYYRLDIKYRLFCHFVASIIALVLLGGMPQIELWHWQLSPNIILNILAVFYLVWLTNIYNFMDGIDGLAATEAISVCVSMACLYALTNHYQPMLVVLLLATAVGGFIYWNFPKAWIFMGDTGSGFLGIILGVASIAGSKLDPAFFWSWLILLGVFIVDATFTLLYRIFHKESFYEGHCNHAYQRAARFYGSHVRVTSAVLLLNALWLLPFAILTGLKYINGFCGLVIAYMPLIILAIKFGAGQKDS